MIPNLFQYVLKHLLLQNIFRHSFYKQLNHLQFRLFHFGRQEYCAFPFQFFYIIRSDKLEQVLASGPSTKTVPYEKHQKFLLFAYSKMLFCNQNIVQAFQKPAKGTILAPKETCLLYSAVFLSIFIFLTWIKDIFN